MSRSNRRKLSEFSGLAVRAQQDNDSEESLFEFEAPRYFNLSQHDPPYSENILNFSIKAKSHDDYWFTYSHFLHEEEENTPDDLSKLSRRVSSIHTKAIVNKHEDNHNTHAKNEITLEAAKQRSESREAFMHHETRAIKVQQTTTKNVVLKSQKKRFTISHTKIETLNLNSAKEVLLGKMEATVHNEKTHVQTRVLNVPATRANMIKDNKENEDIENVNPNPNNHTVKKRKAPTSTTDRDLIDTNPINYKKIVTNTKKSAMPITPVKNDKENQNENFDPVLKKFKPNDSPHPNAKKGEPIKIELRNTRYSKANFTISNNPPVNPAPKERSVSQSNGSRTNMRRSMGGMQFSNNLGGIAHQLQDSKKSAMEIIPPPAQKIERPILADLDLDDHVKNKEGSTSSRMLYEPPKYSARDVRKWEKLSGKNWYNLNCHERQQANLEMEKMIKEAKKV